MAGVLINFCYLVTLVLFQVIITKLKMDKDRKAILERKARGRQQLDKGQAHRGINHGDLVDCNIVY
jgi:hypothetical protein